MRPLPPMLSAAPLILASMAFTRDAAALDFTPEGTLVFAQGAAFTEGFETMGSQPGFAVRESPDALEGKNIGFVNSQSFDQVLTLPLTLPSKDAAYQARMFVRKNRVIASIEFDGGTLAEVNALFYPTGRVTSDGWYEIATAPFT